MTDFSSQLSMAHIPTYCEMAASRAEATAAPQPAVTATAEMMTKAWAVGPSSVMVRSMRAS